MHEHLIAKAYSQLELGHNLDRELCLALEKTRFADYKLITLCVRLLTKARSMSEESVVTHFLKSSAVVRSLVGCAYPNEVRGVMRGDWVPDTEVPLNGDDLEIVTRLKQRQQIGRALFQSMLDRFLRGKVSPSVISLALAMIAVHGLSTSDARNLTTAMVRSGETFDYRPFANNLRKRIVRRYPTGGLSEKVALILPSVLAALSGEIPLLSTTLVGRSLGFTGGTWDKLSTVPGFTFAEPGTATERILAENKVAMCTTSASMNPADRALYLLRSETGAIISQPLIISSIASKHLAMPPHRMLLDVRFGPGAFLGDVNGARNLANNLHTMLENEGVPTEDVLISTEKLNGGAIGNVVEVVEALVVMGADQERIQWNGPLLQSQKAIVTRQAIQLLSAEFDEFRVLDRGDLEGKIDRLFTGRDVLTYFNLLLRAHGVAPNLADEVCARPESLLQNLETVAIRAPAEGYVRAVDQVALGNYVNFGLAANDTPNVPGANRSGVVLFKNAGESVRSGEVLALVYLEHTVLLKIPLNEISTSITNCFQLS